MEHVVLVVTDDEVSQYNEKGFASLGLRKMIATNDKKLAFQLPYPTFATMREGDSPEQIRDEVLAELAKQNISAFVIVAQGFACGRT